MTNSTIGTKCILYIVSILILSKLAGQYSSTCRILVTPHVFELSLLVYKVISDIDLPIAWYKWLSIITWSLLTKPESRWSPSSSTMTSHQRFSANQTLGIWGRGSSPDTKKYTCQESKWALCGRRKIRNFKARWRVEPTHPMSSCKCHAHRANDLPRVRQLTSLSMTSFQLHPRGQRKQADSMFVHAHSRGVEPTKEKSTRIGKGIDLRIEIGCASQPCVSIHIRLATLILSTSRTKIGGIGNFWLQGLYSLGTFGSADEPISYGRLCPFPLCVLLDKRELDNITIN